MEKRAEGELGYLPPDGCHLRLGYSFVKHWGQYIGESKPWVLGKDFEGIKQQSAETFQDEEQLVRDRVLLGDPEVVVGPVMRPRLPHLEPYHPAWLPISWKQSLFDGL